MPGSLKTKVKRKKEGKTENEKKDYLLDLFHKINF
jgi:hypothetical protein